MDGVRDVDGRLTSWLTDNDAAPFGGMRKSGMGRELGEEGLDAFRETKHVHMDFVPERKSYWFPYSGRYFRSAASVFSNSAGRGASASMVRRKRGWYSRMRRACNACRGISGAPIPFGDAQ